MAQKAAGGGGASNAATSLGAEGHADAAPPHASTSATEPPGAFVAWFSTLLLPMGVAALVAGALDPALDHLDAATPMLRSVCISFISAMVGLSLGVKSVVWAAVNVVLPLVALAALPSLIGAGVGASLAPLSTLSTLVESLLALASNAVFVDAQQCVMNVHVLLLVPFAVGRAIRNIAPGVARLADRSAAVLNALASAIALLVLWVRWRLILDVSLVFFLFLFYLLFSAWLFSVFLRDSFFSFVSLRTLCILL